MDYGQLSLIQVMRLNMAHASERQDVLAKNIANADTPGYRATDLQPLDFSKAMANMERKVKMRMTDESHYEQSKAKMGDFRVRVDRKPTETTPVKNTVVLQEQMAKVAENNLDYQTTINLYKKTMSIMKMAVGGKGGA